MYFVAFIFYVILYDLNLTLIKTIKVIIFAFFSGILFFTFYNFLDSFGFFMKKNEKLIWGIVPIQRALDNFPAVIFKDRFYFFFIYMFPNVYYGAFLTHYIIGGLSEVQFYILFLQVLTLNIIFILGIYLNWKNGLKEYEGYN